MKHINSLIILTVCMSVAAVLGPTMRQFCGSTATDAAELYEDIITWEYAQLEFIGILPDAYVSHLDYRDTSWKWSSSEDGVIRREGYIPALTDIYAELATDPPGGVTKDEHMRIILLLDAIGSKGWELAEYDEGAILVNYFGRSNGAHQVAKKWVFKRSRRNEFTI